MSGQKSNITIQHVNALILQIWWLYRIHIVGNQFLMIEHDGHFGCLCICRAGCPARSDIKIIGQKHWNIEHYSHGKAGIKYSDMQPRHVITVSYQSHSFHVFYYWIILFIFFVILIVQINKRLTWIKSQSDSCNEYNIHCRLRWLVTLKRQALYAKCSYYSYLIILVTPCQLIYSSNHV